MAINVVPKDGPAINNPAGAKASGRERAIAKLNALNNPPAAAAQPQTAPVANPSNVSLEELSVVKPPVSTQNNTIVEPAETAAPSNSPEVNSESSAKKPATEESPTSSQYAIMARKEKALRLKAQELKAKEDAMRAQEAEYQSKFIAKDQITQNPLAILQQLGITYDQLTSMILSQGTPSQQQAASDPQSLEFKKISDELKQLREEQQAIRKAAEDQQTKSYQQAVAQIRTEVKQLVNSDPNFESIKEAGAVNDVVKLIEKTFQENGVLLSVEEACNEVDNYLINRSVKLAQLKKVQARLKPKEVAPKVSQQPDSKQVDTQPQTSKTLTNAMSGSKPITARERAILAFQNKLK